MDALNTYGVGTAVADPELKYTKNDTALATVTVAFNRSFKKGDSFEKETTFIKVTVWGKRAEKFAEVVKKGKPVYVNGYLKQENWTTTEGQKRSAISLVATEWRAVEKFSNGGGAAPTTEAKPVHAVVEGGNDESDLPF